jgi:hypothetical protein
MPDVRPKKPWQPRSELDRLLAEHVSRHWPHESVHAQVRIAGSGPRSRWVPSRTRHVGAVIARPTTEAGLHRRRAFTQRLREGPPVHGAVLIEPGAVLDEEVIGRAVVHVALWSQQFGIPVERTEIVCRWADPELVRICARLGIETVIVRSDADVDEPVAGPPASFDRAFVASLDPLRHALGGTFVAGVDLGPAVAPALVRLPSGPVDAVVLYDDSERFLALVADRPVEIVEVRAELRAGAIGRVLVQAECIADRFELPIAGRRIACGVGDPALAWACERLGVDAGPSR